MVQDTILTSIPRSEWEEVRDAVRALKSGLSVPVESKQPEYKSVAEAMAFFRCSRTTLFNWENDPHIRLRPHRIGRKVMYKTSDLVKALEKSKKISS